MIENKLLNLYEEMAEIEEIYGIDYVFENLQVFLSTDKLREFVEDFKRMNDFGLLKHHCNMDEN